MNKIITAFFLLLTGTLYSQTPTFSYLPKGVKADVVAHGAAKQLQELSISLDVKGMNDPIEISWKVPGSNMHNYWTPGGVGNIRPSWSSVLLQSSATVLALVVAILDNVSNNRYTFGSSDALNILTFSSGIEEETGMLVNKISIDPSAFKGLSTYQFTVRIDERDLPYWEVLKDFSGWWTAMENYKPMPVPDDAKQPMFSTWYCFHQELNTAEVLKECKVAKAYGCSSVIVDDGWQTMDNISGYRNTGDWKPEKIPKMKAFVDSVHALGMKFILWYAVPFAGADSRASKKFAGKFLTDEKAKGRATLDPRYPEVRAYLIDVFKQAQKNWGLDGFKLDFVDRFRTYPETPEYNKEMDFVKVADASDKLMSNISDGLRAVNPDLLIEFRQQYTGPLMHKYGNMFRAGDCPYSVNDSRTRTTNIRLLAGNSATHSDMLMWAANEPVVDAALQLLNVMFTVPQISVKASGYPKAHQEMLKFWLSFWNGHRETLINGKFEALLPNFSYPVLIGKSAKELIAGIYAPNALVDVSSDKTTYTDLYFMNASSEEDVYVKTVFKNKKYRFTICNPTGVIVKTGEVGLSEMNKLKVPECGLLHLKAL